MKEKLVAIVSVARVRPMVVLLIQIFLFPTSTKSLVALSLLNNIVETILRNILGPTMLLTHDNNVVQALSREQPCNNFWDFYVFNFYVWFLREIISGQLLSNLFVLYAYTLYVEDNSWISGKERPIFSPCKHRVWIRLCTLVQLHCHWYDKMHEKIGMHCVHESFRVFP